MPHNSKKFQDALKRVMGRVLSPSELKVVHDYVAGSGDAFAALTRPEFAGQIREILTTVLDPRAIPGEPVPPGGKNPTDIIVPGVQVADGSAAPTPTSENDPYAILNQFLQQGTTTAEVTPSELPRQDENFSFALRKIVKPTITAGVPVPTLEPGTQDITLDEFKAQLIKDSTTNPERVREIQQRLKDAGYDVEPTGWADEKTIAAITFSAAQAKIGGITLDEVLEQRKAAGLDAEEGEEGFRKQEEAQYRQQLFSAYFRTWGSLPRPGLIEEMAKSGVSVFEFEYQQRQKPEFETSPVFAQEKLALKQRLADEFGYLGAGSLQ